MTDSIEQEYQRQVMDAFHRAAPVVARESGISDAWLKERFMLMSNPGTDGPMVFKDRTSRISIKVDLIAGTVSPEREKLQAAIGVDDEMWRQGNGRVNEETRTC